MNSYLEFSESWLPVVGYEGAYEISDFGRVKSLGRTTIRSDGRTYTIAGKLLRPCLRGYYLAVGLYKGRKQKLISVHTLVTEAFIGPRPAGLTVDHKNAKKTDNCVGNLEYITPKEQIRRATELGLITNFRENHPMSILREIDLPEIRRLRMEGMTHVAIARQFAVDRSTISAVLNGKTWK